MVRWRPDLSHGSLELERLAREDESEEHVLHDELDTDGGGVARGEAQQRGQSHAQRECGEQETRPRMTRIQSGMVKSVIIVAVALVALGFIFELAGDLLDSGGVIGDPPA